MAKKAQSSTEYLATYGWAMLLLVLVVAFLVGSGIFNPSKFANEECTIQPNLPCTDYYVAAYEGRSALDLSFNVTNTMGFPIAIVGYSVEVDKIETVKCNEASCGYFLKQGDSAVINMNDFPAGYDYTETDFAKLKINIKFKNCKGIGSTKCLSDATIPTYETAGRINTYPRGVPSGGVITPSCNLGARRCIGNVVQACAGYVPNTYWKSMEDCELSNKVCKVENGIAACYGKEDNACEADESKCYDKTYRVPCDGATNTWVDVGSLGLDSQCPMGICKDITTSDGKRGTQCVPECDSSYKPNCVGSVSYTCNMMAERITSTDCALTPNGVCDENSGTCKVQVHVDLCDADHLGERKCKGDIAQVCSVECSGMGQPLWCDKENCAQKGETCNNGLCIAVVPEACEPNQVGSTRCNSKGDIEKCLLSGTSFAWLSEDKCSSRGEICVVGNPCVCQEVCEPGKSRCKDGTIQTCGTDKKWAEVQVCDYYCTLKVDNPVCVECIYATHSRCDPNDITKLIHCGADYTWKTGTTEQCKNLCVFDSLDMMHCE
ncbi:MAG: hypothetical protein WC492_01980 [Candidatus Micrarchaeia archaeon]